MLRPMFGMGGSEIIVILIVALLFLGPDKLPEAAKKISKGIRDIKKQSRVLQRTIEDDEHIGGAIRELKSALRGEDEPYRPPPRKIDPPAAEALEPASEHKPIEAAAGDPNLQADQANLEAEVQSALQAFEGGSDSAAAPAAPKLTLPPTAGEADESVPALSARDEAELAALVKPAPHTIPHSPTRSTPAPAEPASELPESKNG